MLHPLLHPIPASAEQVQDVVQDELLVHVGIDVGSHGEGGVPHELLRDPDVDMLPGQVRAVRVAEVIGDKGFPKGQGRHERIAVGLGPHAYVQAAPEGLDGPVVAGFRVRAPGLVGRDGRIGSSAGDLLVKALPDRDDPVAGLALRPADMEDVLATAGEHVGANGGDRLLRAASAPVHQLEDPEPVRASGDGQKGLLLLGGKGKAAPLLALRRDGGDAGILQKQPVLDGRTEDEMELVLDLLDVGIGEPGLGVQDLLAVDGLDVLQAHLPEGLYDVLADPVAHVLQDGRGYYGLVGGKRLLRPIGHGHGAGDDHAPLLQVGLLLIHFLQGFLLRVGADVVPPAVKSEGFRHGIFFHFVPLWILKYREDCRIIKARIKEMLYHLGIIPPHFYDRWKLVEGHPAVVFYMVSAGGGKFNGFL